MAKKKLYISYKRKPIDTPDNLVDDGKAHFGTFKTPFKNINIKDCVDPFGIPTPNIFNKLRLVEWQAIEINLDEGMLVCAVYNNLNMLGLGLCIYFDKTTKKIYSFRQETLVQNVTIGNALLDSKSNIDIKNFKLEFNNKLKENKCNVNGEMENKGGDKIKFNFDLFTLAPCSNVCIPLGKNKPLYSEKDFLKVVGSLTLNDKVINANDNTTGVLDDHKAFYPYKAHYDWVTTMGKVTLDDEEIFFGLNLTRNQSINQSDYNENVIWVEGHTYPLPPVRFIHDEHNKNIWYIKDIYGYVNIVFQIDNTYEIPLHLGVVDVSYYLPFGQLYGEVIDYKGRVYKLNGINGIGEDKTTRL